MKGDNGWNLCVLSMASWRGEQEEEYSVKKISCENTFLNVIAEKLKKRRKASPPLRRFSNVLYHVRHNYTEKAKRNKIYREKYQWPNEERKGKTVWPQKKMKENIYTTCLWKSVEEKKSIWRRRNIKLSKRRGRNCDCLIGSTWQAGREKKAMQGKCIGRKEGRKEKRLSRLQLSQHISSPLWQYICLSSFYILSPPMLLYIFSSCYRIYHVYICSCDWNPVTSFLSTSLQPPHAFCYLFFEEEGRMSRKPIKHSVLLSHAVPHCIILFSMPCIIIHSMKSGRKWSEEGIWYCRRKREESRRSWERRGSIKRHVCDCDSSWEKASLL